MRHPTRWAGAGIGAVVAAVSIVLAVQVGSDSQRESSTNQLVGRDAPAIALRSFDGEPITDDELSGRAVIVNFWNSWCIPCRDELPALKAFFARHGDDPDFVLLGIVRDDSASAAERYAVAEQMDWLLAVDPDSRAALDFGTRGQPETFAISPRGQIVGFHLGPASLAALEELLLAARSGR